MKRYRLFSPNIVGMLGSVIAILLMVIAPQTVSAATGDLILTGVIDGPIPGGLPKAIELYVVNDIPDLSIYGVHNANNGSLSPGSPSFIFPAVSVTSGTTIYIASESTAFNDFFGFAPTYTSSVTNINGDDAIELYLNGSVVDVFGVVGTDGSSEPWEYTDGWAYRVSDTGQDGATFQLGNWTFSGPNALDGETTNADASTPFPAGTYTASGGVGGSAPTVYINEISISTDGTDTEFVEIQGTSGTSLDNVSLLVIDGRPSSGGAIVNVIDFSGQSIPGDGFFVASSPAANTQYSITGDMAIANNSFKNTSNAFLLVYEFTGSNGDDLDTGNDGSLDSTPWTSLIDSVAVVGNGSDYNYTAQVIGPDGTFLPAGTYRCDDAPAGTFSQGNFINFFDFDGTPGVSNATQCEPPIVGTTLIHDIQGSGATVTGSGPFTVEAIVTGSYQTPGASGYLRGFFIQEEDADADADPTTSEGIFVFCGGCPTSVSIGDLVQVTGEASDFFGMSQLTATTADAVEVISSNNPLPTPATIDLPIVAPDVDAFYEQYEGMLVNFNDTLTVSEYFQLARYGEIVLFEGGRPYQYTHNDDTPTGGEYDAHRDNLARRRVILDDDNNVQNEPIAATGNEAIFYPQPDGLSTGTQGVNFFRGGDTVNNLTGILHWSFAGQSGTDAWRIRPVIEEYPITFTPVNTRPVAPAKSGNITVVSFNVLNYFDGPSFPTDRGAHSQAELDRQTDKLVQALIALDADVYGLIEIENDGGGALSTLVNALNAATSPGTYAYVDTGGPVGSDAIAQSFIYNATVVEPVGSFMADLSTVHSRPPLSQLFRVIDVTNPDVGAQFNVIVNHFKSKGCGSSSGADTDQGDGQGCYNATRTAQANALLSFIPTVQATTGEADVLIIGDLNSYKGEDPIEVLTTGGFTDLLASYVGANAYGYVFDGQLGYLDYALANTDMASQVVNTQGWTINADEIPLFDYNDDIRDTGEASFEREPNANPLYEVNAYRTSDHDPVVVSLDLDGSPPLAVEVTIEGSLMGVINSNNVRTIQVLFDKALRNISDIDPDSVTNPDNFILFSAGANSVLDTSPIPDNFCALEAPASGDDIKITFEGVTYDTNTYGAELTIDGGYAPLANSTYLFVICGSTSIVDEDGLALDGDGDGIGGDDYSTTFEVRFVSPPVVTDPPSQGEGGDSGETGQSEGSAVEGGVDLDGDGVADVTQLPSTGETPAWRNAVLAVGGLFVLLAFGLLIIGSRAGKQRP